MDDDVFGNSTEQGPFYCTEIHGVFLINAFIYINTLKCLTYHINLTYQMNIRLTI